MTHPQHILAEVDSERCDEIRRELAELNSRCSYDELRIHLVRARRVEHGRQLYGYLVLARDKRNWKRERAEELIDLAIYDACIELDEADRAAKASPTTYCNRCGMNPCGCDERVWR